MTFLFWYGAYCVITIIILYILIDDCFKDNEETKIEIVIFSIICFTNVLCTIVLLFGLTFDGISYLFNYKNIKKKEKEQKLISVESYIKQCRGKK